MANLVVGPGTDIKKLKKALKKIGFVLRVYRKSDGGVRYTVHRNTYRTDADIEGLMRLLKGGAL